ncbi:MAG: CPBP family intramembrane metalloprotease [Chloroflexi bacterium]|nr:CPBP family intramembrane metalloprotease [Chloroflexota bacterium]
MILFLVGTLALLVVLVWATLGTALFLERNLPVYNLLLLPAENLFRVGLVILCVLLGLASGLEPYQLGWAMPAPGFDLAVGLLVGAAAGILLTPSTRWAVGRFGKAIYSPAVVRAILPRSRREWVLVPLAMTSAVLLEELLFRSLLIGGLSPFAPPAALAVIGSVVFGAMHLPQGILGMVGAGLLGLLLSALFLYTASLAAPVVAHYVIDMVQLVTAAKQNIWLENYEANEGGRS